MRVMSPLLGSDVFLSKSERNVKNAVLSLGVPLNNEFDAPIPLISEK
jgi:hypothetical protein